ncbi:complex I NDUFA9 subunit family protein [Brevundimonas balnearis]|uniref:Complex I NDUFA9 subunit family protein n=1 Tax=Brevundimonas balnearis TaxID=1572858 RepID=A0ABV6R1C1_9CAUL
MAQMAGKVVVVFGGSGFVGAQAVRALAKRGWRVRVAVRKPHLAGPLRPLGDIGQIQAMRCDITRREDVAAALEGADAAVNLVGLLFEGGGRSFQAAHVDGARHIAEVCREKGVEQLVHISAIGADQNAAAGYARTKGEAEVVVRDAMPHAVILRPSIVFGHGDGFLNRFASLATMAPALPLIGGGVTKFQPVYVGDVAEAIAAGLERADARGRTFELGGPEVFSFKQILELILRETKRQRILLPIPFMAARILGSFAQLTAVIGVAPQLTRDQVLMLQSDNIVSAGAPGLTDLGVQPTGLEAIAPSYLWRYRRGGQFAEAPRQTEDALPA